MKQSKSELRSIVRARRKLGFGCGEAHSLRLIELVVRNEITCLSAYEEFDNEPTLTFFRQWCKANGVAVLLPVIASDTELAWVCDGEPRDLDEVELIVMPALAAGRDGSRLGRGKGYYDRAVDGLATPRVVIVHDEELFETLPTEEFDQRCDLVITCSETIDVTSRLK